MLGREQIVVLAQGHGLGRGDAERVADGALPAVALRFAEPSGRGVLGATRLGGVPDMAEDEMWPLERDGTPLMFVMQLAARGLDVAERSVGARQRWRHRDELVRFFAPIGFEIFGPEGEWVSSVALDREIAPRQTPAGGHVLPERSVETRPISSLRDVHPSVERFEDQYRLGDELDEWSFLQDEVREGARHQLLGWPRLGQHDPFETLALEANEAAAANAPRQAIDPDPSSWRLLLALHWDYENGIEIGDDGSAYYLIPARDLANGNYDRVLLFAAI